MLQSKFHKVDLHPTKVLLWQVKVRLCQQSYATFIQSSGYWSYMWYRTKSLQRCLSVGDHLHLLLASSLHWALRRHLCRLASRSSSDLQIRQRNCRDGCVHASTFDVANRHSMEASGWGAICVTIGYAMGAPWFWLFFCDFFGQHCVTWHENPSLCVMSCLVYPLWI